jgi:hypothetical protein
MFCIYRSFLLREKPCMDFHPTPSSSGASPGMARAWSVLQLTDQNSCSTWPGHVDERSRKKGYIHEVDINLIGTCCLTG